MGRVVAVIVGFILLVAGAALLVLWPDRGGEPPGAGTAADTAAADTAVVDTAVPGVARDVRRSGPLSDRVAVRYPRPGQAVLSPLVVAGEAPGGWYFEATFPLRLLAAADSTVADSTVADSFATAEGEWMTEKQVAYRGALRFGARATDRAASAGGTGAAGGTTREAVLVLERSNASGLPEHEAWVRVPVRLAGPDAARVYFPSSVLDPEATDCRRVHPVARDTAGEATAGAPADGPEAAARRLLDALLAGPEAAERAAGYHTAMPDGATVRSVRLRDGTLEVDFDRSLSEGVAGSCRVRAIRAQVDSTLTRLPGVDRVRITVEGSEAEALQP